MALPKTQAQWRAALAALPSTTEKIPAFFFAHGSPLLENNGDGPHNKNGALGLFLKDFGPALLKKYKPKGILVFSAHWETSNTRLVSDYGDNQPLYYDYYGFPQSMYELQFVSNGSSELSNRVVELFKNAGLRARTSPVSEPRGKDGRGANSPGLDHGVFIPFRIMFGQTFQDVPIVAASIDSSLSPEKNWEIGKAVSKLREEGILILSGGLTVHTFEDWSAFDERTAKPIYKDFDNALSAAVQKTDPKARKAALFNLTAHKGFRLAHPREEHFVPLYVAGGAGEEGDVSVLNAQYGTPTYAFGL